MVLTTAERQQVGSMDAEGETESASKGNRANGALQSDDTRVLVEYEAE